ncbi:MAG: discoidin domain-containing protein [Rikenellaceae bacterium]
MNRFLLVVLIWFTSGCVDCDRCIDYAYRSSILKLTAIDSTCGRGKYIMIDLDSAQVCSSILIEEQPTNHHIKAYKIEGYNNKIWQTIHESSSFTSPEQIYFKPIKSRLIRVHIIKAEKIPIVAKFMVYD